MGIHAEELGVVSDLLILRVVLLGLACLVLVHSHVISLLIRIVLLFYFFTNAAMIKVVYLVTDFIFRYHVVLPQVILVVIRLHLHYLTCQVVVIHIDST